MQAIILAAGEGSRMRPLTASRPKVMLPVAGRPFLEHIIQRAHAAGADSIVLVVGYGADAVRSHFGDGKSLGVKIDYAVQDKQLGTGHALAAAKGLASDRFLVLNGDVLPDITSLREMLRCGDASPVGLLARGRSRSGIRNASYRSCSVELLRAADVPDQADRDR